jgi:hypothetical protein
MSEPVLTPLILRGNLRIGTSDSTAVAVGSEVTDFKVSATADTIDIPATMNTAKGFRGGAASFQIEIGYLPNDGTQGVIFNILWTAIADLTGNKELYFEGCFRDAVISATNPLWTGTFICVAAEIGGTMQTLAQSSSTFPLTGPPTKFTSDSDSHFAFS